MVIVALNSAGRTEASSTASRASWRATSGWPKGLPEVCYPIERLERIVNRCKGQTCRGVPTRMTWADDQVVLPTIAGSKAAGAVVRAVGILGSIRGLKHKKADGQSVRPTLVFIDDPQDEEALHIDTPIPTPNGFVRMADIRAGDFVFDENGLPCKVLATSPTFYDRECYRVVFDDGSSVVADAGHPWTTSTALQRTNARRKVACPNPSFSRRPQCQPQPFSSVVTTEQIARTLTGEAGRSNHSIPLAGPIETPPAVLLVPPYTLGVWLGDGDTSGGRITTADPEILDYIREDGFEVGPAVRKPGNKAASYAAYKLSKKLRACGVFGNKHVPSQYLFASPLQRLLLLQGLMDTDGSISLGTKGEKGTRCFFSNTNEKIIDAVMFLCSSLGIKARCALMTQSTKPNAAPIWSVAFITSVPVFRLSRKAEKIPSKTKSSTKRRFIVAVEPVESRPVRCITVDSASHLYLCGPSMIPTHNSSESPSQCAKRERILAGSILNLAGPGKKIAGLAAVTA